MNMIKKNKEDHPDDISFLAYIDSPRSKEISNVRTHLVSCADCRKTLSDLQSTVKTIKQNPQIHKVAATEDHPDEFLIAEYVDGTVSPAKKDEIKSHIKECAFCLKSAMHYSTHSTQMRTFLKESEDFANNSAISQPVIQNANSVQDFFAKLFALRMPAWVGVPATVFASVFLFLLIDKTPETTIVLSYQENPVVSFITGKTGPGIGFFSGTQRKEKPFKGIIISRRSKIQHELSWPPVENAINYNMILYKKSHENKRQVLFKKTTKSHSLLLDLSFLEVGNQYFWELSGETTNGEHFITKGGFVTGSAR